MAEARLKAGIWVSAQLRRCDLSCIAAYIVRKGDPDAGAILVKVDRRGEGCTVFAQARDAEGRLAWIRGTGEAPVDDAKADAYIRRQVDFDPDLWVIEIDDPDGRYQLDGAVLR